MNPRAVAVSPMPDFVVEVTFSNGKRRRFDVKSYLDTGVFRKLRDKKRFAAVRPALDTVVWLSGQDLCPDLVYEAGVPA